MAWSTRMAYVLCLLVPSSFALLPLLLLLPLWPFSFSRGSGAWAGPSGCLGVPYLWRRNPLLGLRSAFPATQVPISVIQERVFLIQNPFLCLRSASL